MMATPAILPDDLLKPIKPDRPGGEDLRLTPDWIKIRDARPSPFAHIDKGIWTPKNAADTGWPQLFEKTTAAIKEKSKDLQLAIWLTEASTRLHGFAGLRDGLKLIRELLVQFWDGGLFPSIEDGDKDMRSGPLQWLNEKLGELIQEIPVTNRSDTGENYGYVYFLESRRADASVTAEEFDNAVRLTSLESCETLLEDCRVARSELLQLEAAVDQKFGPDALSFSESRDAFEKCVSFLDNAVDQKRRQQADASTTAPNPSNGNGSLPQQSVPSGLPTNNSDGSWDRAEQLVRSGRVSEGLAEMTQLAATEPNGRVRFHRKLLLADICLATKRDRLAKSILEELAELIDKHHLEEWETPQVVGAVWSRLYRCCRNEQAGIADADQAAKLFIRLCRLDPWQALACGDSNK